ncbi:TPA: hypothetical protein ACW479_004507, partial [Salmonella enterica subsp. enterica serovar Bovismorbificans]
VMPAPENTHKFNKCSLFSTFIYDGAETTNNISIILHQAPEYGVNKITDLPLLRVSVMLIIV